MGVKGAGANPLSGEYGRYIAQVDAALRAELDLYSGSEFAEPLRYAIRGGKRIRPVILALSADCVGRADGNAYAAACAVELLHTESVIHDDIIDDETSRRHGDPFHIRYGRNASILTGDFVLGLILGIASRLDSPRITKELATAAMLMSEGEMIEGRLGSGGDVTFDDYLRVIEYKTAAAFEAAARIGGIIGGGGDEQVEALAEFGRNVGMAYQIRDDLTDWRDEEKLFNMLVKGSKDPRDVFDRMEDMLRGYSDKARAGLRRVPDGGPKRGLETLLELTVLKA